MEAYKFRPCRIEPLYYLTTYYERIKDYESGYRTAKLALSIPPMRDMLFVQQWMQDYGMLLECSVCAYWSDRFEECEQISLQLLNKEDLPQNMRRLVEDNLGFAKAKLLEQLCENSISQ